jgi:hypothetical protein
MIDVKTIVAGLIEKKEASGIRPLVIPMTDIIKEVRDSALEELRQLVRSREIVYHETLNGHAFSMPEKQ